MIHSAIDSVTPLTAEFTADGRIVRADPVFHDLHADAGGKAGETIAVPQIAALVQLAARMGTPLSRPVLIAREDADIDLWVHLYPINKSNVKLAVADWQERPRKQMVEGPVMDSVTVFAAPGWDWQIDATLAFVVADDRDARVSHDMPRLGAAFDDYFQLLEGSDEHRMPMLRAIATRQAFFGQHARLRSDPSVTYRLCGVPHLDALGRLGGYRGKAERVDDAGQPDAEAADRYQLADADGPAALSVPTSAFASDLAKRVDHALRLPLGRIIANADTISGQLEGPLRQDYADYASDIASAGRHLLELIEDLADLEAIERPDFAPAQEEVDLCDLARRAAGLLAVKASDRGIRIEAPMADEHAPARAEYRRVLQILVNLVGNAVRYSPDGSKIWLRADVDDRCATIVVADQGGGIDAADHDRVFERFERLGQTDAAGSGLGLYISRRLARAMSGNIEIDSALGQGARLTLRLPRWEPDRPLDQR